MTNVITFEPTNEPQVIWSSGDLKVRAIRSTHIAGHASYRVDMPAGSVVIGGDAGNDTLAPPRASSTSDQVEKLAKGADIIVHSTSHPIMKDSGMPPLIFYRQSAPSDLGAMAKRAGAKHLVLTHLNPPIGDAKAPGDFGRGSNGSRLEESRSGERLCRKYCRGDRSRERPPAGEMNQGISSRRGGCCLLLA